MRSELFVQQRQQILNELLPLITDLKNKKFPLILTPYDLNVVRKKAGKMYGAINLDKVPSRRTLKRLEEYFN